MLSGIAFIQALIFIYATNTIASHVDLWGKVSFEIARKVGASRAILRLIHGRWKSEIAIPVHQGQAASHSP
jgi:hypothetical protein